MTSSIDKEIKRTGGKHKFSEEEVRTCEGHL